MTRFSFRKGAAAAAAVALLGGGLSVGLGQGVASAYDAETCGISATEKLGASNDYRIEKTLEDNGEVAADGTVAVVIKVWREDGLTSLAGIVYDLWDYIPEGFSVQQVEMMPNFLVSKPHWVKESHTVSNGKVQVHADTGWSLTGGHQLAMRVKYKAPKGIEKGDKIDARGAGVYLAVSGGNKSFEDMNLCFTGRDKNFAENITGSLGDLGFGSVGAGSASLDGLLNDPSSPVNGGGSLGGLF